jgi:O-antigen/teichoic acid export membrane protein
LARLVLPTEFGLIAMLSIFLAIAQSFIDSGFSNALVQKKNRTETDYCTVFYFNIAVAAAAYLMLFASAPYIARFYHEPLLKIITRWVGLNVVISAFSIVQYAKLTVKLDFKTIAKTSLVSVIVSGIIGVAMAYMGYGVWALVTQSLLRTLVSTVLLWIFAKWKPALVFSLQSFKTLFAFGSKLLLGGLLHTVYTNLYILIIGKKFNATNLGYFGRAQTFAQFPTMLADIINRVMYPSLCSIQDEHERLQRLFCRQLRIVALVIFPLMAMCCVLAQPLVCIILGDNWLPAVPLISIFCIAYIPLSIAGVNWQILSVKGRSDWILRAEVIRKVINTAILFATMPFGLTAMCVGLVFAYLTDNLVVLFYSRKVIHVGYRAEAKILAPIFFATMLMGGGVYGAMQVFSAPLVQLAAGGLGGAALYAGLCLAMKVPEAKTVLGLVRRRIRGR